MKTKIALVVLVITFLVAPSYTFATTVFETTGWITETEGVTYNFTANQSPYTYQATLSDLSTAPFFGFDFLFLSITTSGSSVDSITGPGSFTFDATPGGTYFANIFATGGGTVGAGLFGLEIATVPIPATIYLLGAGIIGLLGLRRKIKK